MKLTKSKLRKNADAYNRKKFRKDVITAKNAILKNINADSKVGKTYYETEPVNYGSSPFETFYCAFMIIVRYYELYAKIHYNILPLDKGGVCVYGIKLAVKW